MTASSNRGGTGTLQFYRRLAVGLEQAAADIGTKLLVKTLHITWLPVDTHIYIFCMVTGTGCMVIKVHQHLGLHKDHDKLHRVKTTG